MTSDRPAKCPETTQSPDYTVSETDLYKEATISIPVLGSKIKNGQGIMGILTSPRSPSKGKAQAVILAHGFAGHKSYCYLAILARQLAAVLGVYVFRFDFRGCGDSEDNNNPEVGRIISQDIEDVNIVFTYLEGKDFEILAIAGHSRGVLAMFQWASQRALEQKSVPSLINCAGRYRTELILDKFNKPYSDLYKAAEDPKNRYDVSYFRFGKVTKIEIPFSETVDLARQDMTRLNEIIPRNVQILTIHGIEDKVVSPIDASMYANEFGDRHTLKLIPHADHNYYSATITRSNRDIINPLNLPLNSKKTKVNYNFLVSETITEWISSKNQQRLFLKVSKTITSLPRWMSVEGVHNFRDGGGWPIEPSKCPDGVKRFVKPRKIFRSAELGKITEAGKKEMQNLGITAIFDFRSDNERSAHFIPDIPGIENIHCPTFNNISLTPENIALRHKNMLRDAESFKDAYEEFIDNGNECFATVLRHLRDHPDAVILYHCAIGKDRTGSMSMLLLLLCGVDKHTISREYELTATGIKPLIGPLRSVFTKELDSFVNAFNEPGKEKPTVESLAKDLSAGDPNWKLEVDGFNNFMSSKYEVMLHTIEDVIDKKYGGIEGYLVNHCGFTKEDLDIIRSNLISDEYSLFNNKQCVKL